MAAPMLPTLVDPTPAGDCWLHEFKRDGYRTQLRLVPSGSGDFTPNRNTWSHVYEPVLQAAEQLASDAIRDGELREVFAAARLTGCCCARALT